MGQLRVLVTSRVGKTRRERNATRSHDQSNGRPRTDVDLVAGGKLHSLVRFDRLLAIVDRRTVRGPEIHDGELP